VILTFSVIALQDENERLGNLRLLSPAMIKGFNPQPDPPGKLF
jgi:hypothetical protein